MNEKEALSWLGMMDLAIGEEVMILPLAGQPGQGLQGTLTQIAIGPNGPMMVMIRRSMDTPVVSVPWGSILMITRPTAPPVNIAEDRAPADVSVGDLVAMADQMGVSVPDQVRVAAGQ